jgi:lipopolysaccharide export system protein LptA
MLKCLRSGLSLLAHSESGIAMPTVLTVTVISLGFGSVAALSSISAQKGSVRDYDNKTALAAADAGAERALYRHNKIATSGEEPCLVTTGTGALVPGAALDDGWCPEVTGTIGDASYWYRVRPAAAVAGRVEEIDIVSIGTSDEISRRIELSARTQTGAVFGEHTVVGLNSVNMDSDTLITGNTASNGNITMASNTQICGNVQVGPGQTFGGNLCSGYISANGTLDLPDVDQGDVLTNNSNARFFTQDIRSSASRVTYNASTRHLSLTSNSSLTLGGVNYSLCRLTMDSNTDIYVANGASVRIYFDTPENCGLADNTAQLDMNSNSRIRPTAGGAASIALLFVGSETVATRAVLSSNTSICELELLVYGPRTDIQMNSNTSLCGGVMGQTIQMDSNTEIASSPDAAGFTLPLPIHYEPTRYVECSGETIAPPDTNC